MSQVIEILTPVGRLVGGHPLNVQTVVDNVTKQPKMQADGVTPRTEVFFAIAIVKGAETHWNQTPWGTAIHQAAAVGWPNGEYNAPTFSWKVTDGDSAVPNRKGKKPCEREGYPGHWVLNLSTGLNVKSFHAGRYDPTQQIQQKNEIKAGDYCRASINAKANVPSESPGVYLNPTLFELARAGVEIQLGDGPDAAATFGATPGQVPANAQLAAAGPGVAPTPPGTGVAPAENFLQPTPPTPPGGPGAGPTPPAPPVKYVVDSNVYTAEQLKGWNWTEAQIAACPVAQ